MNRGSLLLILHAHLPFVRHPEHEDVIEENWLFEAITECYLPLLRIFERLDRESIPGRITLSLSPPLLSMLSDPLLQTRYDRHLERLLSLAEAESRRAGNSSEARTIARLYLRQFSQAAHLYRDRYRRDLIAPFRALRETGRLELMTTAATHGYLPVLRHPPTAVQAQVAVGQQTFTRFLGEPARGIWLPECGYTTGVEASLKEAGFEYFILDAHGLMNADERPRYGLRAPILCPNGTAAFGRDPESAEQVWHPAEGFPSHPSYREFYRDIGFERPIEELRAFLPDGQTRVFTGLKYHRITGDTDDKELYDPRRAREQAARDAQQFVRDRMGQVRYFAGQMDRPPIICTPFDAELFGHWWFEGPAFLDQVIRQAAGEDTLLLQTPADILARDREFQVNRPSTSSWGEFGYHQTWLNPGNDWLLPHLHQAAHRMQKLANRYSRDRPDSLTRRALNQAARSLLLAQASDWSFILKTGTSTDYARSRIHDHLARFHTLCDMAEGVAPMDEETVSALETLDPIFPDIQFDVYADRGQTGKG